MIKEQKIMLASRSAARQDMLRNAGVAFDICPARTDEEAVQAQPLSPEEIAEKLAAAKALDVSKTNSDALVIGSDQVLVCEREIFSKAKDRAAAKDKLKKLRGKTHSLLSAVAVAKDGEILWAHLSKADLTMHDFDDDFLENYLDQAGGALTACVGAYALEERGVWLFSGIQGDYFTILGMPLLPLLGYLRGLK